MAFPVVSGSTNSQETANTTTSNVTLPGSIASGDLVLAFLALDAGAGTAPTWPSPWVSILADQGTGFNVYVGYLIASGGETTVAVTHTSERSNHIALRITSWHGTTPPEITVKANGSSTTPDPPSLTPSWGALDTLWIALTGCDDSATPYPITAWPYANNQASNATATSAADLALCTNNVNAASQDPGTFTMTVTETWNAYTVAVRPAATGDLNLNLTGVSSTSGIGTLAAAVAIGLSGLFGTGAVGNVAPSQALSGISATAAVDAVGVSVAVGLTGIAATGSVGDLTPTQAISGISATGSPGTVTADRNIAQTGLAGTVAVGTAIADRSLPLSGIAATGAVGSVTASQGGDLNLPLSGLGATGGVGTLAPGLGLGLDGIASPAATGAVLVAFGRTVQGVNSTVSVGSLSYGIGQFLTGLAAATSVGTVGVSGADQPLTGVLATGAVGIVTVVGSTPQILEFIERNQARLTSRVAIDMGIA